MTHPKYTKLQEGNKTDRKYAKWICDLYMCSMVKPDFIPQADIRQLRDLMRYCTKFTNMLTSEKNRALLDILSKRAPAGDLQIVRVAANCQYSHARSFLLKRAHAAARSGGVRLFCQIPCFISSTDCKMASAM